MSFRYASLIFATLSVFLSSSANAAERPIIMLTGYWKPTNEMLRPWNSNPSQNPRGWVGKNWEGHGYDILAFFPEFPRGSGKQGRGDFEVDYADTHADFARLTALHRPVALISFGRGTGPWEVEVNAPDYWEKSGDRFVTTLPHDAIAAAVNAVTPLRAWVDRHGDADDFLCGYLQLLGARYQAAHSAPHDPARMISQGFIHVDNSHSLKIYREALRATLRAIIGHLKTAR